MNVRFLCVLAASASASIASACIDDRALVPATVDDDPSLERVAVNGTLLHVTELGTSGDPLIVFVHGGPGTDHRSFLGWSELVDHGYHLVFYDQRGTGLSRREGKAGLTLEQSVADLGAVVDAYRSGGEPVVLFSHSWGSMLVTGYVNEDPARVAGAVLIEPPGFTRAETVEFFTRALEQTKLNEGTSDVLWSQALLSPREHDRWDYLFAANAFDSQDAVGESKSNPMPFWRWGAALSYWLPTQAGEFDWTTRLSEVSFPVLWFRSEKNRITTKAQQEALAAHYPDVELHLVEGVGHDLHYQREKELLPLVLDYLTRVTAPVTP